MGGLAIGAAVGGRATSALAPRRALRMYAALEVTIALCALVMPAALAAMRPLLAWAYANGSGGMLFDAVRLTVSIVLIAIPAAAMGASFPIGVVAVRDQGFGIGDSKNSGSQDAAALYAMNTIGAALGAALTGFCFCRRLACSARRWSGSRSMRSRLSVLSCWGGAVDQLAGPRGPSTAVARPQGRGRFRHACLSAVRPRCLGFRSTCLRSDVDANPGDDARSDDLRVQRDARSLHRGPGDWIWRSPQRWYRVCAGLACGSAQR